MWSGSQAVRQNVKHLQFKKKIQYPEAAFLAAGTTITPIPT